MLVEILCPYPNYNYQLKTVLWEGTPNTDKVIKISFIFIARRHTRTAAAVDGSGTTAVSTTRLRVAIYISHFSCETLLWATMSTVGLCLRLNCRKRERGRVNLSNYIGRTTTTAKLGNPGNFSRKDKLILIIIIILSQGSLPSQLSDVTTGYSCRRNAVRTQEVQTSDKMIVFAGRFYVP